MTTTTAKGLLTVKEVATRLHIHEETVRREIRDGHLKAYKPGRKYLVSEADLADYVANPA